MGCLGPSPGGPMGAVRSRWTCGPAKPSDGAMDSAALAILQRRSFPRVWALGGIPLPAPTGGQLGGSAMAWCQHSSNSVVAAALCGTAGGSLCSRGGILRLLRILCRLRCPLVGRTPLHGAILAWLGHTRHQVFGCVGSRPSCCVCGELAHIGACTSEYTPCSLNSSRWCLS